MDQSKISVSLLQALRKNDKYTFLQILEEFRQNPPNPSTGIYGWADLFVTVVSNVQYKEYLEILLEFGDGRFFSKDDQIHKGKTALHFACENGCDENVLVLLRRGCDPDRKTNTFAEKTALHIATSKGHLKSVEYLLDYAANINVQDREGRTPLHLAVMSDQTEMVRFLLEKRADTKLIDGDGCSPVHLAFQTSNSNRCTLVRLLVEHDLTAINSKDRMGRTPLFYALYNSMTSLTLVQFLLENGAKIEVSDKLEDTALHYAMRLKEEECLSLLLQSTDMKSLEECLSNSSHYYKSQGSYFYSLLLVHTNSPFQFWSILLNSRLPKSILQAPIILPASSGVRAFHTPLTYLFYSFCLSDYGPPYECNEEKFNADLHLLLKHKITTLDEFNALTKINWEEYYNFYFRFSHPFSYFVNEPFLFSKKSHLFNLLTENGVSTDYCLQCYHDNTKLFASFYAYEFFYEPVIDAMERSHLEALKLMMSNSAILEPDKLLVNYLFPGRRLFFASLRRQENYMENEPTVYCKRLYRIYRYLISLKPLYYTQIWRPSSELLSSCTNEFADARFWKELLQEQPSAFSVTDEFAHLKLQQLCRTTIRQCLREPTLNDNLRNFQRKILALPLPNSLKDYLLFKN